MDMTARNRNMTVGDTVGRYTRERTVGATGVRALMNLAESRGASRRILVSRSGIAPADLEDGDSRIPFNRFVTLMKAAQELCGDPAFALHFGEAFDASEISLGCAVSGMSESFTDAFAQINRFARLGIEVECVGGGDRLVMSRVAGQVWIIDTRANPNEFPELTECTFARMVCSTRRFLGNTPLFRAIHFTHSAPPYVAEYERIFRVPLVFDGDRNALVVDKGLLSRIRPPKTSPLVTSVLKEHAEALLEKLDASKSTRGRVERLLLPALATGKISVALIARELAMSRQTLFRKLKAEGVTFQKVLDEMRHRMALHHMTANTASVVQTARLLGYSDPAAFSRAFKRWTGSSPSARRLPKP